MKPQPVVAPKKKLPHPEEKIPAVKFCLPQARSAAPQAKKTLAGHPRRGTRIDRHFCEPHGPESSIRSEWNVRMAIR
jgi:hypothetical protein